MTFPDITHLLPTIPSEPLPHVSLAVGLVTSLGDLSSTPFSLIDTTLSMDDPSSTSPPPDTTLTAISTSSSSDVPSATAFLPSESLTPSDASTPSSSNGLPPYPTDLSTFTTDTSPFDFTTPSPITTGSFNTLTIVTTIDGEVTTIYSQVHLPTSLASSKALRASQRTAKIVASALGSILILILALALFFFRRRQRQKKLGVTEALAARQKQQFSRAMLFHGEDLDDDFGPGTFRYPRSSTYTAPMDVHSLNMNSVHSSIPVTQAILLRPRGSETGSIFHEEVWPPPGETSRLVDPLVKASSQVDLSTIVDDIMGPSSSQTGAVSSFVNDEHSPPLTPESPTYEHRPRSMASSFSSHRYDLSDTSQTRLWPSESSGSIVQTNPRYSSPLARNSLDATSDRVNFRDSRTWLDRSPKRSSRVEYNPYDPS